MKELSFRDRTANSSSVKTLTMVMKGITPGRREGMSGPAGGAAQTFQWASWGKEGVT